ncbi:Uncharacterised protein [Bacteroides thetaiotaomicron]|nr:Uncharacterised protein [Bacteroides thetaiotaomicron]
MKFGKHGVNGWQRWGLLIQIQTLPNGKTGNGRTDRTGKGPSRLSDGLYMQLRCIV